MALDSQNRTATGYPLPGLPTTVSQKPFPMETALITWAFVFPLITTINFVLKTELMKMPLLLRTFTVSTPMVLPLSFLIMPRVTRALHGWLLTADRTAPQAMTDRQPS